MALCSIFAPWYFCFPIFLNCIGFCVLCHGLMLLRNWDSISHSFDLSQDIFFRTRFLMARVFEFLGVRQLFFVLNALLRPIPTMFTEPNAKTSYKT